MASPLGQNEEGGRASPARPVCVQASFRPTPLHPGAPPHPSRAPWDLPGPVWAGRGGGVLGESAPLVPSCTRGG